MSRDFDGVDDAIYSATAITLGPQVSVGGWFQADTMGGGNVGFLVTTTTRRLEIYFNGTAGSNKLRVGTTTPNQWDMTTGFASLAGWKWALFTYNHSTTTPVLYLLEGATFSVLTPGAGLTAQGTGPTGGADTQTLYWGADASGAYRWNGRLGEMVLYTRILTPAEASALACLGVAAVPDALYYLPWDGAATQPFGQGSVAFTVSGPVPAENPPIRPAGRRG